MRKLLIGHPGVTWKGWLREQRGTADLLCLDPADNLQPRPGQLTLFGGSRPKVWRFYGSVDGARAPHVLVTAAVRLLAQSGEDVLIQAPGYRPGPVMRQAAVVLAEALQPDSILVANGTDIDPDGFCVGPEYVELEAGFPPVVDAAQRKARWLGFIESATSQELLLDRVCFEGARLGSGRKVAKADLDKALPSAVHAELCGSSLFVVTGEPVDDAQVSRAMDNFHASRVHFAEEDDYRDLICSLARGNGEDFAFGIVQRIDFRSGVITVLSDAIPPAPATIIRLGALRVDTKGNERGDAKPWTV